MVQRPIIKLPNPRDATRPTGSPRNPPRPSGPGRGTQKQRFEPTFNRLVDALKKEDAALELRSNPLGIAPDRALVFETAGAIQNFIKAAEKVGLMVIAEMEQELAVPQDFTAPGERGTFAPILYATMPTVASIEQMLSLWKAYSDGEKLPDGFTPWRDLFDLLVAIRVWGPEDRLPVSSRQAIEENLPFDDLDPVRLEIEILPVVDSAKRRNWSDEAKLRVDQLGGNVIDACSIREDGFTYEALLVELTTASVKAMLDDPHNINGLAVVEGIQLILPQTIAQSPIYESLEGQDDIVVNDECDPNAPIRCALFDGTVVAAHPAINNGVVIEDINDLVRFSEVVNRFHATSMASLIMRGDLADDGAPLVDSRILNVPILVDQKDNQATSPDSRLFIDLIHSTLIRLFTGEESDNHKIFVINFSVGIPSERYAGHISALARLLDWWAYTHGVLFVISAGNIYDDLMLKGVSATAFDEAPPEDKQSILRQAMRDFSYSRTLLAPAEAINGLTVGALSEDLSVQSGETPNTVRLEGEHDSVIAISSAVGPGKTRSVKPDVVTAGGVHEYNVYPAGDDARLRIRPRSAINGLFVASPQFATGVSSQRSRGTSCSTALTTRAVLNAASTLTQEEGPYQGEELARQDLALLSRALTVNSATWSEEAIALYNEEKEINGSRSAFRSKERVTNYYGFGPLNSYWMNECSQHHATLVGLGTLSKDEAKIFDLPLPPSLSGEKIGRRFRVTLAWFAPVDPVGVRYKMVTLEAFCGEEEDQDNEWGLGLKSVHIDERISGRGSVWSRRLEHKRLTSPSFEEDATIPIRVQCRDSTNGKLNPDLDIRFAIVVSLEVENTAQYDIHEEIFEKVKIRMQQA